MADATIWSLVQSNFTEAAVALGGVPLLIGGLAGWFGGWLKDRNLAGYKAKLDKDAAETKMKLDTTVEMAKAEMSREVETHKLSLRKQELIFNVRVQAATEFAGLLRGTFPAGTEPPQTTFDKSVFIFDKIEARLDDFLAKYAAVLPQNLRSLLASTQSECRDILDYLGTLSSGSAVDGQKAKEAFRMIEKIESELYALILS